MCTVCRCSCVQACVRVLSRYKVQLLHFAQYYTCISGGFTATECWIPWESERNSVLWISRIHTTGIMLTRTYSLLWSPFSYTYHAECIFIVKPKQHSSRDSQEGPVSHVGTTFQHFNKVFTQDTYLKKTSSMFPKCRCEQFIILYIT